jgi:hypothetical protein
MKIDRANRWRFTYTQDRSFPEPPPLGLPFDNHSYNPIKPPGVFPQAILTVPVLPVNENRPCESLAFTYTQDKFLPVPPPLSPPSDHSYNPFEPPGILPQATLTLPVNEIRPSESSVFTSTQDRFLPVPLLLVLPSDNHSYNPFEPPGVSLQAPLTLPVLPVNESRLGGESSVQSTVMVMNSTPKRLNETSDGLC